MALSGWTPVASVIGCLSSLLTQLLRANLCLGDVKGKRNPANQRESFTLNMKKNRNEDVSGCKRSYIPMGEVEAQQ